MALIHKIRSHFSETYRIRNGFGIWPIRTLREATALYDFCMKELNTRPVRERKLNPDRFQIYKEYIPTCMNTRATLPDGFGVKDE
jgi:hypothetical protein